MIRIGRDIQCLPYAGFFLRNPKIQKKFAKRGQKGPQSKVHWEGTNRQMDTRTDIATIWLHRPTGRFSENYLAHKSWLQWFLVILSSNWSYFVLQSDVGTSHEGISLCIGGLKTWELDYYDYKSALGICCYDLRDFLCIWKGKNIHIWMSPYEIRYIYPAIAPMIHSLEKPKGVPSKVTVVPREFPGLPPPNAMSERKQLFLRMDSLTHL